MRVARVLPRSVALVATFVGAAALHDDAAVAGDAPRAIDVIENDLVADDPAVRAKAAAELTDRYADGAVSVPMLVELLDDEDKTVAANAAQTLTRAGTTAAANVLSTAADVKAPPDATLLPAASLNGMHGLKYWYSCYWYVLGNDGPVMKPPRGPLLASALWPREYAQGRRPYFVAVARSKPSDPLRSALTTAMWMDGLDEKRRRARPRNDADPERQRVIRNAVSLVKAGKATEAWAGARVLDALGAAEPAAIDALVERFFVAFDAPDDPDDPRGLRAELVHRATIGAVRSFGPAAAAAAPRLLKEPLSPSAAGALIAMDRADDVVKALNAKSEFGYDVAQELGRAGKGASAALPWLLKHVEAAHNSRDGDMAFFGLGADASRAAPDLAKRIDGLSMTPRPWLVAFLVKAGSPPRDAFARLQAYASGKPWPPDEFGAQIDGEVRSDALEALSRLAPSRPEAMNCLVRLLAAEAAAPAELIRWSSISSLAVGVGGCGSAAEGATALLVKLGGAWALRNRRDLDPGFSCDAAVEIARALGAIGDGAATALLTEWKTKGDETVRVAAAQALRRIKARK